MTYHKDIADSVHTKPEPKENRMFIITMSLAWFIFVVTVIYIIISHNA